uniref:Uncharacterized protein n=1 Tax=Rhizophora mucronata TaxID=61149 RepID=A0A2P2L2R7_RHIMU
MIINLKALRDRMVFINSKMPLDSPEVSKFTLQSKNSVSAKWPFSSKDSVINSSCSTRLPALKKSLSSQWNILNCSINALPYCPGSLVILASIASVATKSSGPAFR